MEFENSFNNPLSSRVNSASSTVEKVVAYVRTIVRACGFDSLESIYTEQGLNSLQKAFDRKVTFSTKKNMCAAFVEFLQFIEFRDELPFDERKRLKRIAYLKNACIAFSRGCKFDNAYRRVKLAEMMYNGEFPLYSEVSTVFQALEKEVAKTMKKRNLSVPAFKVFIAFIAFGLALRCMIRPGALVLMTVSEFLKARHVDDETYLVHVKAQKAATYNDGFVNVSSKLYELLSDYLENFRQPRLSDSERLILKPNGPALTSQELGLICKDIYHLHYKNKDFGFTEFRQHCQTIFAHTCSDELQLKWFNKVMVHR